MTTQTSLSYPSQSPSEIKNSQRIYLHKVKNLQVGRSWFVLKSFSLDIPINKDNFAQHCMHINESWYLFNFFLNIFQYDHFHIKMFPLMDNLTIWKLFCLLDWFYKICLITTSLIDQQRINRLDKVLLRYKINCNIE